MDVFTKIDRRTMRAYWSAAAFIILIASVGAATIIFRDYKGRINNAGQHAMNLAQTLAEHTTQIFVKLDALSRAIIEDSTDIIVSKDMLSEVMRRRAAAEPAAMGIAIIDVTGRVIASGANAYLVGMDVSKSPEFQALKRRDAPQYYISKPTQENLGNEDNHTTWIMNYARRMEGVDGKFTGIVLIIVDEPYLYGFYKNLDDDPGRVIGLVGEDGIIRASNVPQVIGRNIEPFIQQQIQEGKGVTINPSVRTGIIRIFAYYRSSAVPLLAYVGTPVAPIYQAWLIASAIIVFALLALFSALVALGTILGKFIRSRDSLIQTMIEASHERQEKEFLETIVNTRAMLVAVADANGRFIVTNPTFRELFPDANATTPDTNTFTNAFGIELEQITPSLPWKGVHAITPKNGIRRELSWSISPIFNKGGEIKNLVAIGLDFTELREVELGIYQASKLVTLGEMATGIAHEINQPLAVIAMEIDNALAQTARKVPDNAKISERLELANGQVERAASIVRHMRIYGRRSDGSFHPVDPAEAIVGALTVASAQVREQGIEIQHNYEVGKYKVVADLLLIEQILLNLLMNARDAIIENGTVTEANDNHISICLERDQDGMVVLSVSDTGPGIPQALLDRLFDPFFTTKPVGKGTGLGLALSHGMARDMGGRIEARNTENGAEFRLLLREAVTGETI